ncbi:hypothetical protein E2C01_065519 [Portunus trituberculatus]|uniref:Uncharacterized protein n=1 Tax=Portunus trituberculatus TaxID=210409 RepID=A0A5B7HPT8_PORTR|nr:hypothetical protein [Portunus trituberculatus]
MHTVYVRCRSISACPKLSLPPSQEADMSSSLYTVSQARSRAVAFSYPFTVDQFSFSYVRPVLRSDVVGFIKPLSLSVSIFLLLNW